MPDRPRAYHVRAGVEYATLDPLNRGRLRWTHEHDRAVAFYGTIAELRAALATYPATSPAITFEPCAHCEATR